MSLELYSKTSTGLHNKLESGKVIQLYCFTSSDLFNREHCDLGMKSHRAENLFKHITGSKNSRLVVRTSGYGVIYPAERTWMSNRSFSCFVSFSSHYFSLRVHLLHSVVLYCITMQTYYFSCFRYIFSLFLSICSGPSYHRWEAKRISRISAFPFFSRYQHEYSTISRGWRQLTARSVWKAGFLQARLRQLGKISSDSGSAAYFTMGDTHCNKGDHNKRKEKRRLPKAHILRR